MNSENKLMSGNNSRAHSKMETIDTSSSAKKLLFKGEKQIKKSGSTVVLN